MLLQRQQLRITTMVLVLRFAGSRNLVLRDSIYRVFI